MRPLHQDRDRCSAGKGVWVCGCVGVWVCGGGWGDPFEGSILLPYPTGVHALEAEEPLFVAEDDRAEGGVGPYHVQRGPDAWKWPQS